MTRMILSCSRVAVVAPLLLLLGCGGVARVAPPGPGASGATRTVDRCQALLDQRDASVWGAAFAGGLAGVGGLSTAFPEEDGDTTAAEARRARLGLGISAAVLGALGTSLSLLARMKSAEFEQYCNVQVPALPAADPGPPVEGTGPGPVRPAVADDAPDAGVEP